ncbi:lambda-like phage minor tail protein L [Vreelandella subterranea]|uniref:Lambda-like phage minor tail protein L n=1 Tax=Vreelandella subterranea TaxID=416874 RepID=A0A1H9UTJ6_9GAMM|nr:phage minor tail protein L [Halomonas subterranea]SES12659.1 lambda-like phage minor tail protein L [Halomonas subterranea]
MSEIIARESQLLEQGARVFLFEIEVEGIIRRFVPGPVDGGPAYLAGNEYLVLPIKAEGFEWNGKGTMPRPTLNVTAKDLAFLALVESPGDLVGSPVRRLRTYRKYLDDGTDPDPEALFPVDHYVIERKASQNRRRIQFELSAKMDQEGRKIPARQVLRDTCTHRYRWWDGEQYQYQGVTCPYAGAGEWSRDGSPVSAGNDACGKRLSDCRLRFGEYGDLPFRGFPGVARY